MKLFHDNTRANFLEASMFEQYHPLNEMATISSPKDNLPRNTKVCVYGEGDEQGTKVPHYHVLIDHGKIELEVYIQRARGLVIWRTKNNRPLNLDCDGITDVRKKLQKWLDQPSANFREMTNLDVILSSWNANNPNSLQVDSKFAD